MISLNPQKLKIVYIEYSHESMEPINKTYCSHKSFKERLYHSFELNFNDLKRLKIFQIIRAPIVSSSNSKISFFVYRGDNYNGFC